MDFFHQTVGREQQKKLLPSPAVSDTPVYSTSALTSSQIEGFFFKDFPIANHI